jgi:hypothetical protein
MRLFGSYLLSLRWTIYMRLWNDDLSDFSIVEFACYIFVLTHPYVGWNCDKYKKNRLQFHARYAAKHLSRKWNYKTKCLDLLSTYAWSVRWEPHEPLRAYSVSLQLHSQAPGAGPNISTPRRRKSEAEGAAVLFHRAAKPELHTESASWRSSGNPNRS